MPDTRPPSRIRARLSRLGRIIMLVTDRNLVTGDALDAVVQEAIAGGVNAVQLRERDLPAAKLLALARRLRGVCGPDTSLTVNDRADVALLAGADGVHLGSESLPVAAVRQWLPPSMGVGRSVHTVHEARQAEQDGADYVLAGAVFPTATHPQYPAQGPEFIAELKARLAIPVIAIGGITPHNVAECWEAGADGAAVIRALLSADDPAATARALALREAA